MIKKAGKIAGLSVTIIVVVVYLACSLTPFIPPTVFPFMTLLSLGYLPMLLVYALTALAWSFVSRKKAIMLLIISLVGFKSFFATVGLNVFQGEWKPGKDSTSIRVLCWNVNALGNPWKAADTPGSTRQQILKFIQESDADILCLQDVALNEAGEVSLDFVNNITGVMEAGGYSCYTYPYYFQYKGSNYSDKIGVALFTRLPCTDSGVIVPSQHEKAGYIDLLFRSKPLRVYAAHMTSMSLWPNTREGAGLNYLEGDSTQIKAKTIAGKLMSYGELHAREAMTLKAEMNKSPHPLILGADLNSVPSSFVYHHLKSGLRDAFLQKDFGVGGTYNRIFPKLRIDVLLHSPQLEVVQFTRPTPQLSDHFPLIADLKWKE